MARRAAVHDREHVRVEGGLEWLPRLYFAFDEVGAP